MLRNSQRVKLCESNVRVITGVDGRSVENELPEDANHYSDDNKEKACSYWRHYKITNLK